MQPRLRRRCEPKPRAALTIIALCLASAPSQAADSQHFKQTAPASLAVIPQGATNVTLSFQIDWAGLKTQYGNAAKVGLSVFFPCCYNGIPLGGWVQEGETSKTYAVDAIKQAMTQHNVPKDAEIRWSINLHFVPNQAEKAESGFFLNPPHRPGPRYAPSLAPDSPSAWPAKFVVTNDGDGVSEPSSLAVSVTLLETRALVPRGSCKPAFSDFTRDVPVLAPGAKFEIPMVDLSIVAHTGKLPPPSGTRGPQTSKLTPPVSCKFQIRAETGPPPRNAGAPRPIGVYLSLTRTITVEVPAE